MTKLKLLILAKIFTYFLETIKVSERDKWMRLRNDYRNS